MPEAITTQQPREVKLRDGRKVTVAPPDTTPKIVGPKKKDDKWWLLLLLITAADIAQAEKFWRLHSPRSFAGMLGHTNGFGFDEPSQQWTKNGRPQDDEETRAVYLAFLASATKDIERQAGRMARGRLPLDDWEQYQANVVKSLYIASDALGRGGIDAVKPSGPQAPAPISEKIPVDLPGALNDAVTRLKRFADEVESGSAGDVAKIVWRSGLYAGPGHGVYEFARRESHRDAKDEDGKAIEWLEENILDDLAEHCHSTPTETGCPECTDAGLVPLGTLPSPGLRQCSCMCRCTLRFSVAPPNKLSDVKPSDFAADKKHPLAMSSRQVEISGGRFVEVLALAADSGWATINGVHVHFGSDGKIDKGPSHMIGHTEDSVKGKKHSELIEQEYYRHLGKFTAKSIPAGTPNKKALEKAAAEEASRQLNLPENRAKADEIWGRKKSAERKEKTESTKALNAQDPIRQRMDIAHKHLSAAGFKREKSTSSGSRYYTKDAGEGEPIRVRVSDHEVPETDERAYNAKSGGFSWATQGNQIIVDKRTSEDEIKKQVDALHGDKLGLSATRTVHLSGGRSVVLALKARDDAGGHWVTVDGGTPESHALFIRDGAGFVPMHLRAESGESKRFTRDAIEKKIVQHHETYGGGHTAHAESELSSFVNPFKFKPNKHGKLPEEIANQIGPGSPLRSLITLAKPGEIAQGEDAMGTLGQERYLDIAHGHAEGRLSAAKKFAANSPDPEMQFLNHIHDNLPEGESRAYHRQQHTRIVNKIANGQIKSSHIAAEVAKQKARGLPVDEVAAKDSVVKKMRMKAAEHAEKAGSADETKQVPFKAGELRVGHEFTMHGNKFRVGQDDGGHMVLHGGTDYGDTPLDALSTIPVDEGSFKRGRMPKKQRVEIPFGSNNPPRVVRLRSGRTVNVLALSQGHLFGGSSSQGSQGHLFSGDKDDGVWRTIEGVHVFIKGGKITKGPHNLEGKTVAEAKETPREAAKPDTEKYHQPQTAEKNMGNVFGKLPDDAKPKAHPSSPENRSHYIKKGGETVGILKKVTTPAGDRHMLNIFGANGDDSKDTRRYYRNFDQAYAGAHKHKPAGSHIESLNDQGMASVSPAVQSAVADAKAKAADVQAHLEKHSGVKPGLFGQPTVDAIGSKTESMFGDNKLAPVEKHLGSANANDPKHTPMLPGVASAVEHAKNAAAASEYTKPENASTAAQHTEAAKHHDSESVKAKASGNSELADKHADAANAHRNAAAAKNNPKASYMLGAKLTMKAKAESEDVNKHVAKARQRDISDAKRGGPKMGESYADFKTRIAGMEGNPSSTPIADAWTKRQKEMGGNHQTIEAMAKKAFGPIDRALSDNQFHKKSDVVAGTPEHRAVVNKHLSKMADMGHMQRAHDQSGEPHIARIGVPLPPHLSRDDDDLVTYRGTGNNKYGPDGKIVMQDRPKELGLSADIEPDCPSCTGRDVSHKTMPSGKKMHRCKSCGKMWIEGAEEKMEV